MTVFNLRAPSIHSTLGRMAFGLFFVALVACKGRVDGGVAPRTMDAASEASDGGGGSPDVAVARTNVLLIIADDVSRDEIGIYGGPARTPQIDALAARGVRFENAWTNPLCSPTRASIYTGRHAFRHRVGTAIGLSADDAVLQTDETTIAELLAGVGYGTGLFGKWHLGAKDSQGGRCAPVVAGGFEKFVGSVEGMVPDYQRWTRVVGTAAACDEDVDTTYATTKNVDDAVAWIRAEENAERPWMASLAFNAAHSPLHVPPPELTTDDLGSVPCGSSNRRCFLAMVEAMDHEIGRLLAAIEGSLDRTLVIFVGDNGTAGTVVAPGVDPTHAKGTVYQEGVTVPFILAGPNVTTPGRASGAFVNALDIFRTIAEVAGLELEQALPGRTIDSVSLVPYLLNPAQESMKTTLVTEVFQLGDPTDGSAAIRNARYKLIVGKRGQKLFDLALDPKERIDLLKGPLTPEQRASHNELEAEFNRLRATP